MVLSEQGYVQVPTWEQGVGGWRGGGTRDEEEGGGGGRRKGWVRRRKGVDEEEVESNSHDVHVYS